MDYYSKTFVMLSQSIRKVNPTEGKWYISEKYDGVRAIWDPQMKTLISRNKQKFRYVPQWFIDLLPANMPLEGELIIPDKPFRYFSSISVMKEGSKGPKKWKDIVFYIFDTPIPITPFYKRKEMIEKNVELGKHIQLVQFTHINLNIPKDKQFMESYYQDIISEGGEGIMLIRDTNIYQPKRVNTSLKYKKVCEEECTVIGYEEGKGKYKGCLGKLVCRTYKGTIFRLGSGFNDLERKSYKFYKNKVTIDNENVPKIDNTITYTYLEKINDVPRLPIYKSVRAISGTNVC